MKTRKGFVSNSSSASFIITINNKLDEVIEVYEHPFDFDRKVCKEIELLEKKTSNEQTENPMDKFLAESRRSMLEKFREVRRLLEEDREFDAFLKLNGIDMTDNGDNIVLERWVVMFNEYLDMGKDLAEFVLRLKAMNKDFTLRVEED